MTLKEEFEALQVKGCSCQYGGESDTIAGAMYLYVNPYCSIHGTKETTLQEDVRKAVWSIFDK